MKRILIVSHAMEIGGAEKALLGLLETIDTTKYEVDLFLLRHRGELLKEIPDTINLLPEIPEYTDLAVPISEVLKKRHFKIAFARYRAKKAAKNRVKKLRLGKNDIALEYSHKYTAKYMPDISNVEYDVAISFLTPHYFVAEKTKAKKKIAWIHTDYSTVSVDKASQLSMWNSYNSIVSISKTASKAFCSVFPELENKVTVIQNILPINYISRISRSVDVFDDMPNDGAIKLLSIGRFCVAKNFDNIPKICCNIKKQGLNVKWYIIGFGADEMLIRERIHESGMDDSVIIIGKKTNPYPYIKNCDIYVQPSRFEGRCVSVTEAQLFAKPVIITDYPTAKCQLEDGVDGIIVPLDNDMCAQGIVDVINNSKVMNQLTKNCLLRDYSSKSEIFKLYALISDK
ncbi:MAG: glycosyltransferase [Eubacterium sp.]|nr:glycosyltransferase [Eubacterium sp.]